MISCARSKTLKKFSFLCRCPDSDEFLNILNPIYSSPISISPSAHPTMAKLCIGCFSRLIGFDGGFDIGLNGGLRTG